MKVLVCGGRDFADRGFLFEALDTLRDKLPGGITFIIEGGAKGADALAREWAILNKVPYETYDAEWEQHRKAAGVIRNQHMLQMGKPDIVLAMPGGKGTADMVRRARKVKGLQVLVFKTQADRDDEYWDGIAGELRKFHPEWG